MGWLWCRWIWNGGIHMGVHGRRIGVFFGQIYDTHEGLEIGQSVQRKMTGQYPTTAHIIVLLRSLLQSSMRARNYRAVLSAAFLSLAMKQSPPSAAFIPPHHNHNISSASQSFSQLQFYLRAIFHFIQWSDRVMRLATVLQGQFCMM